MGFEQDFVNGINGATGDFGFAPLSVHDAVQLARGDVPNPAHSSELNLRRLRDTQATFGPMEGIDPKNLSETGWGIVFPHDIDPAIIEALSELINHRRNQAAERKERCFQVYAGDKGYFPDETKQHFLARHGASAGMPVDPNKVPYYLLLVGTPEQIPYRFQYELDLEYAVGRICLESPREYASYAHSVVEAENGHFNLARRATFFGVENAGDRATQLSATKLVSPLAAVMAQDQPQWQVEAVLRDEATKAGLIKLMGGGNTPALLFTASHGMMFPNGDSRQLSHQGALLCQDWPGREAWKGSVPADFYLSADDICSDTRLSGLIAFHFACFGAGTPQLDDFPYLKLLSQRESIAPKAFVARLPQRLLGHPLGGALAVIGHVERAWAYSFLGANNEEQLPAFQSVFKRLMEGHPVGSALDVFNQRYANLAAPLLNEVEQMKFRQTNDESAIADLWTACNDARSYIILGDPAVRLCVSNQSQRTRAMLASAATIVPTKPDPARSDTLNSSSKSVGEPTSVSVKGEPATVSTIQALPFAAELIAATETRIANAKASQGTSFDLESTRGRLMRNSPDAVRRRLRRLGLSESEIGAFNERISSESFAITGDAVPTNEGAELVLERILGRNDLMGVQYLELGQIAARCVGRVIIRDQSRRTVGYGTGFLVSPRLLLTNNHVLDSAKTAATSQVQFDYQEDMRGSMRPPVVFDLDPESFFLTSPMGELDFSLVAVRESVANPLSLNELGMRRLTAVDGEILAGETVSIIQHPNGEPKQLALRENRVIALPAEESRFLHYETDTAPGSSGSPVFNDQWEVVALHHSGVPRKDAQGRLLTREGQLWTQSMGEHRIDWVANEGVRVAALVAHLRAQVASLQEPQRQLLVMALEGGGNSALPDLRPPLPAVSRPEVGDVLPLQAVISMPDSGTTVWTIPLQVIVKVGSAVAQFAQPRTDAVPAVRLSAGTQTSLSHRAADEAEVSEAIAEFERGVSLDYFDKRQDDRDRDAYYQDVDSTLGPVELFRALSRKLSSTHTTQLTYQPMKRVYPWVDLQPNRKIRSIYSGQEFDPVELIREDFSVEMARRTRFEAFLATEAATNPALKAAQLELLEAMLPYNCEHVVPQSWFGKLEPMRGDLHHLFACESGCNSFRGNTPYFDFTDFGEAVRQGCGKRETNRFEPTSGKGTVARATMYFLLRYPGEINRTAIEYSPDRLTMLLNWHRTFPPGEYERHRNQAIFAKQGNRNPLVDHPEWADRIEFGPGLKS